MSILSRLHTLSVVEKTGYDVVARVTVPITGHTLKMLDELAEELGISRSKCARECLQTGVEIAMSEFRQACESAAAAKKAERDQLKLKMAGGAK